MSETTNNLYDEGVNDFLDVVKLVAKRVGGYQGKSVEVTVDMIKESVGVSELECEQRLAIETVDGTNYSLIGYKNLPEVKNIIENLI